MDQFSPYSVALYAAASFIYAFLCEVDFLFELGYSQKMTMKYIKPDGMEFSLSKYVDHYFNTKKRETIITLNYSLLQINLF